MNHIIACILFLLDETNWNHNTVANKWLFSNRNCSFKLKKIAYELLILEKNTSNRATVCKQMIMPEWKKSAIKM